MVAALIAVWQEEVTVSGLWQGWGGCCDFGEGEGGGSRSRHPPCRETWAVRLCTTFFFFYFLSSVILKYIYINIYI